MTPDSLVGLLADTSRLRVVAALALGSRTVGQVVDATGLDDRSTANALRRLESAGLVTRADGALRLRAELFAEAVRTDRTNRDPFVNGQKLIALPARRERRREVLEQVCASFEPGRRYPERDVDAVLREWCDGGGIDHVTVRRYLVDEGLLSRADGQYWRSGGPVEV
ncbi:DUF2087 domain-containing protein [Saccharothrix violaceirubra]|uniref:HTH arsR-type domain-containing protein n=1 Tax=Saccharothrix violaceirubra TaxID=413306 RepID=A0A7W7T5U1_9PSEU|nr:DUF2087 domain-containing protein [Saccharothrix violaceirubra]MBB4967090.1 hypothetical protein [Saccharothrix violaceirubra]